MGMDRTEHWTPEREDMLRQLRYQGKSMFAVARAIGLSVSSVRRACVRLGLPTAFVYRPAEQSPPKPAPPPGERQPKMRVIHREPTMPHLVGVPQISDRLAMTYDHLLSHEDRIEISQTIQAACAVLREHYRRHPRTAV